MRPRLHLDEKVTTRGHCDPLRPFHESYQGEGQNVKQRKYFKFNVIRQNGYLAGPMHSLFRPQKRTDKGSD